MKEIKKQKVLSGFEKMVSKVLNIARHEWGRVSAAFFVKLLFQIALVAAGTVLLALFVEEFSVEKLPILFILQSLLMILGTIIFSGLLRRIPIENLIILGSIFAAALFFSAVFFGKNNVLFFGFLLVGGSVFLGQLGIWIALFVQNIFSPLEGERTFPLVESSEPVGGLLAGLLILAVLPFYDADKILIFVGAILLTIVPILLFSLEKLRTVPRLESEKEFSKATEKRREVWKNTFRFFRHSPFLTGLFAIVFLQFFIAHFLDFQFTKAVDAHVSVANEISEVGGHKTHGDLLTHSLGQIYVLLFTILFFFQLFFASRILQKIGVMKTFAAGPILSFFAFFGMLASFSFPTAVVSKFSFKIGSSIGKNAFGASFYAIRENFHEEAKEFLEGIGRPLGSFFGTLFIFLFQQIFSGEVLTTVLSGVLVAVSGMAVILAFHLQKHYTLLGKKNLEIRGNLDEKINAIELLSQPGHRNATDYLVGALLSPQEIPEVRIKILGILGKMGKTDAIPAILKCLEDSEKTVRIAAVNALGNFQNLGKRFFYQSFSRFSITTALKKCFLESRQKEMKLAAVKVFANLRDPEIIPLLIDLLKKKDPEIRAESISVIGLFHDPGTVTFLEPLLSDPHPKVRSAAIIALWQFVSQRMFLITEMSKMLESKKPSEILAGIDAVGETRWELEKPRIQKFLTSKNEKVRHHAAFALAKMNDENSVEHLFDFMFHKKKFLGKKTRSLLEHVHEDVRHAVHRKSLHEVARRISEILKKSETNIIEHLPQDALEELHHLFSLIGAEKEMGKIKMMLIPQKT